MLISKLISVFTKEDMDLQQLPTAVTLELPLRVRHPEKTIPMVGGPSAITAVASDPSKNLELRLREDPFHHPVNSRRAPSCSVVLEVEIPVIFSGNVRAAIAAGQAKIVPKLIGHPQLRWREMADFQYYTGDLKFADYVKTSLFALDQEKIEQFAAHDFPLPESPRVFPPVRFSQQPQPFFYNYKQNPLISVVEEGDGTTKLVNKNATFKLVSHILAWGDPIPSGPPEGVDPHPRPGVSSCIDELHRLFEARPCYTRRVIDSLIPEQMKRYLRYALPYVAYFYRSGPWRGSYFAYGKNPRQSSDFAVYQVEHFRILPEDNRPAANTYQFDGKILPATRMLQLCDVTEPFLKEYIYQKDLRTEVDSHDGWYPPVTMRIIRRVMRAMLVAARDGCAPLETRVISSIVSNSGSLNDSSLPEESMGSNSEDISESEM